MKIGDRIEMVHMPSDPDPILSGSQGTIENIQDIDWPGRGFQQLWVKWDDGRTLSPIIPPDVVRVTS